MIWKTTNRLGQEVTWYSEDEYNKLLKALFDIQELLELGDKDTDIDRALEIIDEVKND